MAIIYAILAGAFIGSVLTILVQKRAERVLTYSAGFEDGRADSAEEFQTALVHAHTLGYEAGKQA